MLGVVLLIISPAISIIQSGNAAPIVLVERVERLNFVCQSVDTEKHIDLYIFYGSRGDKDLFFLIVRKILDNITFVDMGSDDSAILETRNAAGEETGCLVARGPGKGLFVCSRLAAFPTIDGHNIRQAGQLLFSVLLLLLRFSSKNLLQAILTEGRKAKITGAIQVKKENI